MRRFLDRHGVEWEVWVGRESWGVMVALLVPSQGGGTRRAHLSAGSPEDAERQVESLDETGLNALLDASLPADLSG